MISRASGRIRVSDDPVDWLYGLQSHGIKLGLDGIRALLLLLDHPERLFPVVLVGGTNGKGSVVAMLDALLRAHGRRAGVTTSPHLVRPEERIRIDGTDVSAEELARVLSVVRTACDRGLEDGRLATHSSFFEVITAASLVAFRDARVDVAVLEVGLGGRLDATNATEPVVSAIVTIDLDHTGTLGTTLSAIAQEKVAIAPGPTSATTPRSRSRPFEPPPPPWGSPSGTTSSAQGSRRHAGKGGSSGSTARPRSSWTEPTTPPARAPSRIIWRRRPGRRRCWSSG
jgi:hypothetical protein